MKINFLFLLMLSILFLNGCATTHYMEFTAVAMPYQKTDPYGTVVSEKMHMVSMSQYKEIPHMGDNAIFNIIIENGGEEPLTIGNENITAIFEGHDKKHTVKKLDVLSAREFMNDVEYEYRKIMLRALSHRNDYISATSLDGENEKVKFMVVLPFDYGAGALGAIGPYIKLKVLQEILPDLIFDQKTIMPRESVTVLISCRTNEIAGRKKGDLKITVSIDGEEHRFTFTRR